MVITIDYWRLLVPERDDTHMIMDKGQFNSQASGSDMGMARERGYTL